MRKTMQKSLSVVMALAVLFTQTMSMSARPSDVMLASIDESVLVLDEAALDEAMQELNELDAYLSANEGTTYEELALAESDLIAGMDNSASPFGMENENEPPLGIPSFLWGCLFGLLGIILVYLVTDGDTDETKKALYGMLVWIGVGVVLYFAVFSAAAVASY